MKRTREVFETDQIPHMWAHQYDSPEPVHYARNKQGNFWYRDDIIYSYGTHFPIAKLVKKKDQADPIVLFTTRGSSPTTNRQMHAVRMASSHLTTFHVHDVGDPDATFKDKKASIKGLLKEAKATKHVVRANGLLTEIKQIVHDVNRWKAYRGVAGRIQVPKEVEPILESLKPKMELHAARVAQAAETRRENRAKEWAARDERQKEEAEEWRRWEMLSPEQKMAETQVCLEAWESGGLLDDKICKMGTPWMRVRRPHSEHAFVETTMGVVVPLKEVEKIWEKVKIVMATGNAWERNGEVLPAGHYQIDAIKPDGSVDAGCHHFSGEAILRLAKNLGWYEPKAAAV